MRPLEVIASLALLYKLTLGWSSSLMDYCYTSFSMLPSSAMAGSAIATALSGLVIIEIVLSNSAHRNSMFIRVFPIPTPCYAVFIQVHF